MDRMTLKLKGSYTREEIHSIFSPHTKFSKGSGTWGNHGKVPIPDKEGDFVFMLSYGVKQGDHAFVESIDKNGTLRWQSQPQQKLTDKDVQTWINHDENFNDIHLFLNDGSKEKGGKKYEYMGRLKYLDHDDTREKPVYFQWQLIDWEDDNPKVSSKNNKKRVLSRGEKPLVKQKNTNKEKNKSNINSKPRDYASEDARNKKLGDLGERLVVKYETEYLKSIGHDLEKLPIVQQSLISDNSGYDIKSYDKDCNAKYIEVKTTRGSNKTAFFISSGELKFADNNKENYFIYRVYDYNEIEDTGKYYLIRGIDLHDELFFECKEYRVKLLPKKKHD